MSNWLHWQFSFMQMFGLKHIFEQRKKSIVLHNNSLFTGGVLQLRLGHRFRGLARGNKYIFASLFLQTGNAFYVISFSSTVSIGWIFWNVAFVQVHHGLHRLWLGHQRTELASSIKIAPELLC